MLISPRSVNGRYANLVHSHRRSGCEAAARPIVTQMGGDWLWARLRAEGIERFREATRP
jgi:hypothetical protein